MKTVPESKFPCTSQGVSGLKKGCSDQGEEVRGIPGVEERLTGGVGVVPEGRVVFVRSVVKDDDAFLGEERGRTALDEAAVEKVIARFELEAADLRPVVKVFGRHEVDFASAVVEPVFAIDPGGDQTAIAHGADEGSRAIGLDGPAPVVVTDDRAGFCPMQQVFGGRHAHFGLTPILGVKQDFRVPSSVSMQRGSSQPPGHSRSFWPSTIRVEDGFRVAGEMDAVGAGGEADAGGGADVAVAEPVAGAVEEIDFAILDDRGGIEGVAFPVDRFFPDGVVEDGVGIGSENRRCGIGPHKRTKHPIGDFGVKRGGQESDRE